jgi:nicotinate-nucleotide adenylyltransferase
MEMDRLGHKVRIGIFGGTFDPIHYGHLRVAEEARESFALNRILFIPSANPPHKRRDAVSSVHHRLKMLRRAIACNKAFESSDLECRRPGASYSVETLHTLREGEGRGVAFYFIVGLDAFLEIQTWRSYTELFELSHWLIIQRPGAGPGGRGAFPNKIRRLFEYDPIEKCYVHPSGCKVFFRRFRLLEISSSEIRRLSQSDRSVRYLTPKPVEEYILEHHIYK